MSSFKPLQPIHANGPTYRVVSALAASLQPSKLSTSDVPDAKSGS